MGYMDYEKLWQLLDKKGLNKFWLRKQGVSSRMLFQMQHYESVTTNSLCQICELLNCQPKDIMEYKKGEPPIKSDKQ